ncbi:MAG: BlaI/MecI/CopY family transcriptional regulator [Sphingomicrobium sp.]
MDELVQTDQGAASNILPPEVLALFPRMREIASVVYLSGGATAKEVHSRIEDGLTIYGIRTLLNRLATKGIVRRRRSGRHTEVLYLPAIVTPELRQRVMRQFLERNFDGSVSSALQTISRLVR